MNLDAIEALSMNQEASLSALPTHSSGGAVSGFGEHMRAEFNALNDKLASAEGALQKLATGEQENIHHVILALEDARMSFQLLVQVRNKVLEAYQEVMRMQV